MISKTQKIIIYVSLANALFSLVDTLHNYYQKIKLHKQKNRPFGFKV